MSKQSQLSEGEDLAIVHKAKEHRPLVDAIEAQRGQAYTPDFNAKDKEIDYRTEDIGKWQAKQESPFAAQNRRSSEAKVKSLHRREKAKPFIIAGAIVAACVVALIVTLVILGSGREEPAEAPTIAGNSVEDIYDYQEYLQSVLDESQGDPEAVAAAVEAILNTDNGQVYNSEALLAQAQLLYTNYFYQEAVDVAAKINVNTLNIDEKISYYDMLSNCQYMLGNEDLATEYRNIRYDLAIERGGNGG